MRMIVLATVALAGLAGCSYGNGEVVSVSAAPLAEGMVTMPAKDLVSARRTTFFLSTRAVAQAKAGIEEGGDLGRTRSAARMLRFWAESIPTMFPEGSNVEGTRALDSVWTDRAGFEERAAAYRDAADALAAKAEAGDREGANAAFMAMAGTCHACHEAYRME